jgi:hypothetical protein
MSDPPSPKTERHVQPLFMKFNIFRYLPLITLFLAVMVFGQWVKSVETRSDGPTLHAAVRFQPVPLEPSGFLPLKLAGAWEVQVDDPRFGGVSALAMDGAALLAVTDSGSVFRLPLPGRGTRAFVRDLPAGPGTSLFKIHRDSEALAPDPAGRGWWVAFEHWHQLWLSDPKFGRALERIDRGKGRWPRNGGGEAMAVDGAGLLVFRQSGTEWLRVEGRRLLAGPLESPFGALTDAVRLADGRLLLVTRKLGFAGLEKQVGVAEEKGISLTLRSIARLGLGRKDTVEGMAAQKPGRGGTRLWLITDTDFRPRKATLLVALDLP